jgi:hypothetical protein
MGKLIGGLMANREQIIDKLMLDLDNYATFEEKSKYLKEHKYLDRIYEKYPEIEQGINSMMITSIQEEFGSSESDQFSFSKDVSNRELLRIMDLVEKNDEILQNEYFGQEGIDEMERVITEKNAIAADIKERKTSLQDNIGILRQEFDDRTSAFTGWGPFAEGGGPLREIPFLGLVLPETLKYLTQLGAGWTDLFRTKGMEKIETRMFNWDPEAQRYGPGPEIGIEQDKLAAVLAEEEAFEEKYGGASTLYEDLGDLLEVQELRKEQIKASGIDEALDYISMENLTKLLQGQQLESNEELLDVSER